MAFYAHSVHSSTSAGILGRCAEFGAPEQAKVHTYNDNTKKWSVDETTVRLSPTRFAEGTNRYCYKILDLTAPSGQQEKVAKVAKSLKESRKETFTAVVMQKRCQRLAERFNALGTPKKMNFIDACIIELVQRPIDHTGGPPLLIMEPLLQGQYKKHSNNFGFVDAEDRCTPQCFSHFTFEHTNQQMIVVDIQGVGDLYTDPQIHSNIPASAPPIWGEGDMGDEGIHKFFETHRCNALCKQLGLSSRGGSPVGYMMPVTTSTTAPLTTTNCRSGLGFTSTFSSGSCGLGYSGGGLGYSTRTAPLYY
uniref:Alpha-type protein kinase domain-containing protein n=1 Tax=Eutreptiella gymnastica TaxID=73025 RepID=A0A7S1JH88_9EUGL